MNKIPVLKEIEKMSRHEKNVKLMKNILNLLEISIENEIQIDHSIPPHIISRMADLYIDLVMYLHF